MRSHILNTFSQPSLYVVHRGDRYAVVYPETRASDHHSKWRIEVVGMGSQSLKRELAPIILRGE